MDGPMTDSARQYYGYWTALAVGAGFVAVVVIGLLSRIALLLQDIRDATRY